MPSARGSHHTTPAGMALTFGLATGLASPGSALEGGGPIQLRSLSERAANHRAVPNRAAVRHARP